MTTDEAYALGNRVAEELVDVQPPRGRRRQWTVYSHGAEVQYGRYSNERRARRRAQQEPV